MNTGGGATLVTAFEAVTGTRVVISAPAGGADALPQCCFKRKAAPNTNAANNISAKTNFGLINFVSEPVHHKQKIQDKQSLSWIKFLGTGL
jgi:hypothetical protein